MKNNNHIIGGISGIIEASLYVFGFVILFFVLQPTIDESISGLDKLKFIMDNKLLYQTWILAIYVIFGIVLVPLTVAIHENFQDQSAIMIKITPVFGLVWSGLVIASGMIGVIGLDAVATMYKTDPNSALTSWKTLEAVQNGLGGGVIG